jgi:hypothetical protein
MALGLCRLFLDAPQKNRAGEVWRIPKGGRDSKKSVHWSDTDVILPGESIDKAIVSLQIPEVLNDEALQVL